MTDYGIPSHSVIGVIWNSIACGESANAEQSDDNDQILWDELFAWQRKFRFDHHLSAGRLVRQLEVHDRMKALLTKNTVSPSTVPGSPGLELRSKLAEFKSTVEKKAGNLNSIHSHGIDELEYFCEFTLIPMSYEVINGICKVSFPLSSINFAVGSLSSNQLELTSESEDGSNQKLIDQIKKSAEQYGCNIDWSNIEVNVDHDIPLSTSRPFPEEDSRITASSGV